jgi:periplasmic protein TonB
MRSVPLILLATLMQTGVAQDTTYFSTKGLKVHSLQECHVYEVVERNPADTNAAVERTYFRSGQIRHERHYLPYHTKTRHGRSMEWYENGLLRRQLTYDKGKLHGELLTYWDNGRMKRQDLFEQGKLVEGRMWNPDATETDHYDYEILPEFPGGMNSLVQYLGSNLNYPKKPRNKGVEGRVLVYFVVEKDGSLGEISVKEGVHPELDAEVLRVVRSMPKWTPGMEDGEKVRVAYHLPIRFKLT